MDGFRVTHPGLLSTIQDLGRYGRQQMGLSPSGALDDYSLRMGNAILGNSLNAAVLEMVLWAPALEVLRETVVAITGAQAEAVLNGNPLPLWEAVAVSPGDVIEVKGFKSGLTAYLSVAGGFDVPEVLGSRATDILGMIGGLKGGKPIAAGDTLPVGEPSLSLDKISGRRLRRERIADFTGEVTARVVLGPQDDHFTDEGLRTFLESPYVATAKSDRMGVRLEGPCIEHRKDKGADILSEGMPLGTVQVPKNGQPIVLLAGRQTVGGYSKIAVVVSADVHRVAQRKPGDSVRFCAVTLEEAHELLRQYESIFLDPESLIEERDGGLYDFSAMW